MSNPTARWVTLGGCFRFFETFTIVYFMPAFYSKVFPMMQKEYSILNGIVKGLGGFLSVMLCGVLSDRFEKKQNRMIKS